MSPSATTFFTGVLTLAARQGDQFRADRLGDGIQLALAQVRLEEFHVGVFHADHSKAGASFSFAHITALTHKNFSHAFHSFS
jgi:hypothetical protein